MKNNGIIYSSILHIAIFVLAIFGLPSFFDKKPPEPMVISIDVLPISAMTNVKPSDKARREKQAKKPKKKTKKQPKSSSSSEDSKPEKKKNPVKIQDKDKKKDKKKKEDKKKSTKDKKKDEQLLKNLKKEAQNHDKKKKKKKPTDKSSQSASVKSDKAYDNSIPLSISEKDAILSQFYRCWRAPAGSMNDYDLKVKLKVKVDRSGTVKKVSIPAKYKRKYKSNTYYRAAVDSAVRAVWKCSPIKKLPQDKYNTWKDMELNFDPRDMLY